MSDLGDPSDITLEAVEVIDPLGDVVPTASATQEVEFFAQSRSSILLQGLGQDIAERKIYAKYFFRLACSWLFIITLILLLQGLGLWNFKLQDNVVLALIGSTTVNILGILYVVANYLFPKR